MGIHTGPKDGDYARYVEYLSSGTAGEPGKVYANKRKSPAGWSVESEVPPLPDGFVPQPVPIAGQHTPTSGEVRRTRATTTAGRRPSSPKVAASEPTLASRSARRTLATVFRLIAFAVLIIGVRMIAQALGDDTSDGDAVIPGAFLVVFAFMLFKGARGLRRDADRAGKTLPPLTTFSQPTPRSASHHPTDSSF